MLVCSHLNVFIRENPYDFEKSSKFNLNVFYIGILISHIGSWIETIADYTLMKFKSDSKNKGKILTTGVWSLCRHPNYFGETMFWWGTFICNLSLGQWWMFYPCLLFTLLLIFVSGVYLTEKGMKKKESYSDEYKKYLVSTKKFIPFIW